MEGLLLPLMVDKVVLGHLYGTPCLEVVEVLQHEIHVEGIRVIEVVGCNVAVAHIGGTLVVGILLYADRVMTGFIDLSHHSALATAAASCNSNEFNAHLSPLPHYSWFLF